MHRHFTERGKEMSQTSIVHGSAYQCTRILINRTGKLAFRLTAPLPWIFPAKEKLPIHPSLSSPVQKLC